MLSPASIIFLFTRKPIASLSHAIACLVDLANTRQAFKRKKCPICETYSPRTVPTSFRALGIDDIEVGAEGTVEREIRGLEVVMVLDNTGSMSSTAGGGVSKLDASKTAGATLLKRFMSLPHLSFRSAVFSNREAGGMSAASQNGRDLVR